MTCLECGMETAEAARFCARCGAPATAQPSAAADPAVGQLVEDACPEPDGPRQEKVIAASGFLTSPSVPQRPVRRGVAFAGAGIALLAGIVGLIAQVLDYTPYNPGVYYFGFVAFLVPTVTAVAALRRIDRLMIVGLLQGMWWPAVAFVAEDVVSSSADHMFGATGRLLAAYWVLIASDVLGAAAAILLVVSWSPAVAWRRASRILPLSVLLLCGIGLAQIFVWIFYATQYKFAADDALGIAGLLVGLAVTWYAVNLRASALGGALVLGWSGVMTLWLLTDMNSWTASAILGCILLATVIGLALALIYMRPNAAAPEPLAL